MMWFVLCTGFLMLIPIAPVVEWCQSYHRSIDSRLEKEHTNLRTFRGVFVPFLILLLHVLKGFALPWLSENSFFVSMGTVVVVLGLTLAFDIWSPLTSRKNVGYWLVTLLGLYWFMSPWFLVVAPLLFVAGILLFNSIGIGVLAAIVAMFIPIWMGQLDAHFFASNAVFFIVALICNRQDVFLMMDGKKETLLMAFRKR